MAVVTPQGRLLYVKSLWTAKRFKNQPDAQLKYSCSIVVDKVQQDPAQAALLQALFAEFNTVAMTIEGAQPPQVAGGLCILPYGKRYNILDGAVRFPADPFFADKWVIGCSRSADDGQPQVILGPGQPVMDKAELYDGAIVQAHISFYAYGGGTGGVNADCIAVMKVGDAEPLGGHALPDSDEAFAAAGAIGSGPTVAPVQAAPANFGVPGQPAYAPQQPVQPVPQYVQPAPVAQPVPGVPVQPAAQLGAVGTPPAQPWQ